MEDHFDNDPVSEICNDLYTPTESSGKAQIFSSHVKLK